MDVDDLIARQDGVVSRDQARQAGLSRRQIDGRVARGSWVAVHRGVYRHRAAPQTWRGDVIAAVLATGGVASHRCAAALWQLELYERPRPEVTVASPISARLGDVRVHWSTQWDRRDPTMRDGIPCTGVERTILDCAAVVCWRSVERLAEAAIRKRQTSWPAIARCLQRHAKRGRNGCGPLRKLLEMRLGTQVVPLSDFSRLVANLLDDHGLPPPTLEHVITDRAGRHVLQVDLAWPALRKAWELDGLQWHFGRSDVERDRRKRNRAIAEGWVIQEILWSMYVDEPEQLVALARKFLHPPPF